MSLPLPPACEGPRDFLRPTTSGRAVLGLVFGLLSLAFGVLASVPAFVFAARGLGEINRDPAHVRGRGLALLGIFAAGLGLFLQPLLLIFAVQTLRDLIARRTDAAQLRRIGQAMYAYNDDHGHLPPAALKDVNNQPLLSWRVALLPYLGEQELYEQFHLDEPWDSRHNAALVHRMPKVYGYPADPDGAAEGLTYYRVFVGNFTPFGVEGGPGIPRDFENGTSHMILVAAAAEPVPWTKPEELACDANGPIPKLGGLLRGGYNVLMADGETHFVRADIHEAVLRGAIENGFRDPW
jgi:hypothetical protein